MQYHGVSHLRRVTCLKKRRGCQAARLNANAPYCLAAAVARVRHDACRSHCFSCLQHRDADKLRQTPALPSLYRKKHTCYQLNLVLYCGVCGGGFGGKRATFYLRMCLGAWFAYPLETKVGGVKPTGSSSITGTGRDKLVGCHSRELSGIPRQAYKLEVNKCLPQQSYNNDTRGHCKRPNKVIAKETLDILLSNVEIFCRHCIYTTFIFNLIKNAVSFFKK